MQDWFFIYLSNKNVLTNTLRGQSRTCKSKVGFSKANKLKVQGHQILDTNKKVLFTWNTGTQETLKMEQKKEELYLTQTSIHGNATEIWPKGI